MSEEYPNLKTERSEFRQLSKSKLYELYWVDGLSASQIAERYGVGERTVSDHLKNNNIQQRLDGTDVRHYVLWQRDKHFYYELYWEQGHTARELEDMLGVHHQFILEVMQTKGVPRDTHTSSRWHDKEAGVPEKYKWSEDHPREDPSSSDEPLGKMPEDPTPSDYINDVPLRRNKDRLYKLYWQYGMCVEGIAAISEVSNSRIRECMDEFGIPRRDYHDHLRWHPHHGVPPKYEWPDDHEQSESTIPENAVSDYQNSTYLSPKAGDD